MSETQKYFEHITGQSLRVVPTRRGWWFVRDGGQEKCVRVRIATRKGVVCRLWPVGPWEPVGMPRLTWLRPVPSAEAVQAAEPVVRKLLSGLDEHWKTTAEGVAAIAAAEQLIAGLTGGEG